MRSGKAAAIAKLAEILHKITSRGEVPIVC